jgi:hypothetical protein
MSDRFQEISQAGSEAYDAGRTKESALLYEQAYRYAKEFQRLKSAFEAGVWSAISWENCGDSIRALDLLMELLQTIPPDAHDYHVYLLKKYWFIILFKYNPDLSDSLIS